MSHVTGFVLCFTLAEGGIDENIIPQVDTINAWLAQRGHSPLHKLDELMCNGKHLQMSVYGGGYNYLDDHGFFRMLAAIPWVEPDEVILTFNPENGTLASCSATAVRDVVSLDAD